MQQSTPEASGKQPRLKGALSVSLPLHDYGAANARCKESGSVVHPMAGAHGLLPVRSSGQMTSLWRAIGDSRGSDGHAYDPFQSRHPARASDKGPPVSSVWPMSDRGVIATTRQLRTDRPTRS